MDVATLVLRRLGRRSRTARVRALSAASSTSGDLSHDATTLIERRRGDQMTNEQLAIVLANLAHRLEREINLLRAALPAEMEREEELAYIGDRLVLQTFDTDPEHWRKEPGDYVALGSLTSLVNELNQNVETLRSNVPTA